MGNWLQQLQQMLGNTAIGNAGAKAQGGSEALNKMLAPGALGGLAGILISSKSSRNLLTKYGKNALIIGGSAAAGVLLWDKYKQRVREARQNEPQFGQQATPVDRRAERLITALVFAAKSDGHMDGDELRAIRQNIHQAGYGEQAEALIQQAIDRPLDPQWLAQEVKNEEEALELYFLSCAAIDIDHFMERSYLKELGDVLKIPADVREDIEKDIRQEKQQLPT